MARGNPKLVFVFFKKILRLQLTDFKYVLLSQKYMAGVCGQHYLLHSEICSGDKCRRQQREGRTGRGIITEPILGIGRIKR
jgi:hypothetical protein